MHGLENIRGLAVGDLIAGKYRIDRLLGRGSMGVVVAATHLDLLELRAIKVLISSAAENPELAQRFAREARIAARLKSEHAVRLHDVGRLESGLPYMVMEFLEGRDLRYLRKQRGTLPLGQAIFYVIQACDALAEAHALGLVHRDIKPGNLLLARGPDGSPCIKVLDFGITKVLGASSEAGYRGLTSTGQMLGTPHFMPPEQMSGQRDVDARADIWAIGSLLYVLLTGRYPMQASSQDVINLVMKGDYTPPLPSSLRLDLPPELDAVLLRCLERDREKRYSNVGELVWALKPFAPAAAMPLVGRIARMARRPMTVPPSGWIDARAPETDSGARLSSTPLGGVAFTVLGGGHASTPVEDARDPTQATLVEGRRSQVPPVQVEGPLPSPATERAPSDLTGAGTPPPPLESAPGTVVAPPPETTLSEMRTVRRSRRLSSFVMGSLGVLAITAFVGAVIVVGRDPQATSIAPIPVSDTTSGAARTGVTVVDGPVDPTGEAVRVAPPAPPASASPASSVMASPIAASASATQRVPIAETVGPASSGPYNASRGPAFAVPARPLRTGTPNVAQEAPGAPSAAVLRN